MHFKLYFRSRGRKQIFPLKGADGEDSVHEVTTSVIGGIGEINFGKQFREGNRIYDGTKIATALKASNVGNAGGTTNLYSVPLEVKQIGQRNRPGRENLNQYRTYSTDGVAPCLNKMDGGGREPHIPVQFGIDYNVSGEEHEIANCLKARYDAGVSNFKHDRTAVAIPVLTPDRAEKRQNGRRFKDNGDESFTLTAQDRHGVALKVNGKEVYAVWYEKYNCYIAIRKLTPLECFRLQGWTDDYFQKAAFVNSDSQLYKQAGNGVTVDVVQAIAEKLKESETE